MWEDLFIRKEIILCDCIDIVSKYVKDLDLKNKIVDDMTKL